MLVILRAVLKKRKRIYDAHELFTEQKEIISRPVIHKFWLRVERFAVPRFKSGYTVNQFIVNELKRRYDVNYGIIRNLPLLSSLRQSTNSDSPFIIYQGAVNEGRSFENTYPRYEICKCKTDYLWER